MITNICLLLEILSIIFCVHCLYGEKFRFDIVTISFLSIHMIIMTVINYYELPPIYSMSTYFIMFLYCGVRFGFHLKAMIINNVLYLVIIGGIQVIITMCYSYIFGLLVFNDIELLTFNFFAFLMVIFFLPKIKINKLSVYLQDKDRILVISLIFCIILTASSVINYKMIKEAELYQYMSLFLSVTMVFLLAGQFNKFKIKSQKAETELKMHQMYADSFHSLINDIRSRQHEFDDHLSAIFSQHYVYHTFDELVTAQRGYSQLILKENKFNKLLTLGNSVIIGFLYGKFKEIEKLGIDVSYNIDVNELDVGVPVYKLVEILGNLIKNAVEEDNEDKKIFVSIIEVNDMLEIEVRNKSRYIELDEIDFFFRKGFSKKGNDRGMGLYNVKNICNEYALCLLCENKKINNENWFSFVIKNKVNMKAQNTEVFLSLLK